MIRIDNIGHFYFFFIGHSNNEWAVSMIPIEQYECKLKASKKAINGNYKN